jgi:hypothetical protein
MKKLLLLGLCLLAGMVRAQDFTAIMTPEDRAATGIDRLTPAELARLQAVVERYKSGEVAVVRQEAAQQVATVKQEAEQKVATVKQEAAQKIAVAEAKVQQGETPPPAAEKSGDKKPGWFSALVTLQKAGEKADKNDILEGRLAGKLKSFSGTRSFTLADGQVWKMTEGGSYHGPELDAPAVRIMPGFLGTFWLQIREAPLRVKVQPVKVE